MKPGPEPLVRGRVKFWKATKGWGAIESASTPADVFAHFGDIDMEGYRELFSGEEVEFQYEAAQQDSFTLRATYVRPTRDRRQDGAVGAEQA